jgi:hypothetical protein
MPDDQLIINVGGSALSADLGNLQPWYTLLNCADSIAIQRDERECLRVDLDGLRRWIVFERKEAASPFLCIGYQETVGLIRIGPPIPRRTYRDKVNGVDRAHRLTQSLQPHLRGRWTIPMGRHHCRSTL